jgi:hypothetical protein
MYLVDIDGLKTELKNTGLAEKEKFKYLLVFLVPYYFGNPNVGIRGAEPWIAALWVAWIIGLFVGIGATVLCYRRNGGSGGRHFLQRYLSLSWVLSIRFTPLTLVVWLSILGFGHFVGASKALVRILVQVGFLSIGVLFYCRLLHHIHEVAQAIPNKSVQPTVDPAATDL